MNLEDIRTEIDLIDQQLVNLLEKRMDLVSQVAAYKKENHTAILDSKREVLVLEKVAQLVQNSAYQATIQATFSDIMKHSRIYQQEQIQKI